MAFSINRATLLGNATKDVELRYTPGGTAVAKFSIATNRSIKKDDSWEDIPTFHNIVAWAGTAEYVAKTLKKGMKVYVEGRIENRSYEDKEGVKRYITEVVADSVIPMANTDNRTRQEREEDEQTGRDAEEAFKNEPKKTKKAKKNLAEEVADDIPF
jgi:single-strand DNA-binding protein